MNRMSSEHPGVPQRPQASAHLLVDSVDRYKFGYPLTANGIISPFNWRLNFQNNVMTGYFTRLSINQIQFCWNLPTIMYEYNDTITFKINGGAPSGVTIDPGFYTPAQLASEIQGAITVAGGTGTCQFIDKLGYFAITPTGGTTSIELVITDDRDRRFLSTTGFTGLLKTSLLIPYIVSNVPSMLPTRYVDICSQYLTKYQRVKDNTTLPASVTTDVIARVYPIAPNTKQFINSTTTTCPSPAVLCIDYNNPKYIMWSPGEAISNFDIQVKDEDGNILPDTYPCEYQLTILTSET